MIGKTVLFNSEGELATKIEKIFNILQTSSLRHSIDQSKKKLDQWTLTACFFSFQSKLLLTFCLLFLVMNCLVESHQNPNEEQSILLHRQKRSKELIEKIKKVGLILFKYTQNWFHFFKNFIEINLNTVCSIHCWKSIEKRKRSWKGSWKGSWRRFWKWFWNRC